MSVAPERGSLNGTEYLRTEDRLYAVVLEEGSNRAVVQWFAKRDPASARFERWEIVDIKLERRVQNAMQELHWAPVGDAQSVRDTLRMSDREAWAFWVLASRADAFLKSWTAREQRER